MNGRFVAYYRVSTSKQGIDGLGMDAQKTAVRQYLNGGSWELLAEFSEVESGKKDDRPELEKAIRHCKMTGSKLLIAKLDRLSRDVHFVTGLQKAGVPFVCCDMPEANEMTIQLMAVMAQAERKNISDRTKKALAAIKDKIARGEEHRTKKGKLVERLGGPNGFTTARNDLGRLQRSKNAAAFAQTVAPTIKVLRGGGLTLQGVADRLNEMRVMTSKGSTWTPMAVKRVLDRVCERAA